MSTSHFPTLVQQRPPGVNAAQITTTHVVTGGGPAQHIILNNVYKGPVAVAAGQPRNGVRLVGVNGQPGQAQQIQYQLQQQQVQLSPQGHQIIDQQELNRRYGSGAPIYIETTSGTTLQQQQQQPMKPPVVAQPSTGSISAAGGTGANGMLLTEIKTEPMAFSPSSPSVSASSPLLQQPHIQQQQLQPPLSPPDWKPRPPGGQQLKKPGKGPTPRPQEELCLVCADRASGYHYNALACEGCKGFFRRSITRNSSYACKYGDQCEIDMYMRRKCQACRLKKCYAVGMKPDCVVPEHQCKTKRELKEKKKQEDLKRTGPGSSGSEAKRGKFCQNNDDHLLRSGLERQVIPRTLLPEEEELINRLVYYQREYESPSENDLNKVYHVPLQGSAASESEQLFRHMTEMTILTVQLIVDFSKHLPGFHTLCRDDQVVLLKGCSSEVMMLRGARKYDPITDSIVFATNHPFTKENYVKAGLGNDELFRFCRRMTNMKVDNAEFALVTAIDIFSERHGLYEPKRVEKIQEIYVDALHSYVMANRRSEPMVMFSKLLSVLTELRSLGYHNSRMCIELRMEKNKKLPDFLEEIWDLK